MATRTPTLKRKALTDTHKDTQPGTGLHHSTWQPVPFNGAVEKAQPILEGLLGFLHIMHISGTLCLYQKMI